MFRSLTRIKNKKFTLFIGLVVTVSSLLMVGLGSPSVPQASASQLCGSSNDILSGGFSSPSELINDLNNKPNSSELQHIYQDTRFGNGLDKSQYDDFKNNAKHGYTDLSGNIYLDNGTKVGSDAGSIGRQSGCQGGNPKPFTIQGAGTYYGSPNAQSINPNTPRLNVYILLNSDGKATFAVMTDCGNPLYFPSPPKPTPPPQRADCTSLNPVVDRANPQDYTFTTTAPVANGASIDYVVYDFGDGTTRNPNTQRANSPNKQVAYSYGSGGTYTVTVTVHAVVDGKNKVIAPAGQCIKKVKVPQPSYSCKQLESPVLIDNATNTYKFTATADYDSNATPTSADFTVSTGNSSKTYNVRMKANDKTASLQHAYGLINASSKVYVIFHFNAYAQAVSTKQISRCTTAFATTIPYCKNLTGPKLSPTNEATFTATAVLNGRKLKNAVFNFGDHSALQTVNATTATTVVVNHPYASAGPYDASATLYFVADGNKGVTAPACTALVNVTITPECKPGVPVGDERCTPCLTNPTILASDTANCVPPEQPELPNTGAGNTIAIFAAVVIGGFLVYRQLLFRKHKTAFVAAQAGTSPLPLGDALNDAAPLADTPLAPKPKTFRRKRPF